MHASASRTGAHVESRFGLTPTTDSPASTRTARSCAPRSSRTRTWKRRRVNELGTGSDVEDKALAARLVRLIDDYEDAIKGLHARCAGDGEEGAEPRARRLLHERRLRRGPGRPARPRRRGGPCGVARHAAPTPRSASPASTSSCRGCSPARSSDRARSRRLRADVGASSCNVHHAR